MIAPTGWENALPLRYFDGDAPTRAAVSGCLTDGRELVGLILHVMVFSIYRRMQYVHDTPGITA
jgi:hypothetical protein